MTEEEKVEFRKTLAEDPRLMAAACRLIAQARIAERRIKGEQARRPPRHRPAR
jgi:hypothetical protein